MKRMISWKTFTVAVMAVFVCAIVISAGVQAQGESESFKKYGQEFEGKIAKRNREKSEMSATRRRQKTKQEANGKVKK